LWVWFGRNTTFSAQARQYGFSGQFASTSPLPAGIGGGGGKHSILTIYSPIIYTAQYEVVLMQANAFTQASGRGLDPGNREFFSPVKWQ